VDKGVDTSVLPDKIKIIYEQKRVESIFYLEFNFWQNISRQIISSTISLFADCPVSPDLVGEWLGRSGSKVSVNGNAVIGVNGIRHRWSLRRDDCIRIKISNIWCSDSTSAEIVN